MLVDRRLLSTRSFAAALTAGALALSGCAGLVAPVEMHYVDLDSPAMRQFPVAAMTDMERDVRLETGTRRNEGLTPPLFWTGIGVGTLGAVGGITFGVMGFITDRQLDNGYYDGNGMTVAERDRMVRNGELYNGLAIGMTALSVLGYALAIVTYGVDWNRCGPLVEKKRRCKELGLGTHAKRASFD
jgi:hypothetical protein